MTPILRNTVLVIDDDPDCRDLIEALAQIRSVPVLQAHDCGEGLRVLEREHRRIKIILLDYFMPGMEPTKCVASIVARAGTAIPVVLITAAVNATARAAELNVSRCLSKPFDIAALETLLTEAPRSDQYSILNSKF
jgi:CheY-like chemotaxis protein